MDWTKFLTELCGNKPPLFLATATTGVSASDRLLAACWAGPEWAYAGMEFLYTDEAALAPARRYHGITMDIMANYGRGLKDFTEKVWPVLSTHTVFSYNVDFQKKFLGPVGLGTEIYSIPFIIQHAARGSSPVLESRTIQSLYTALNKIDADTPSMKAMCRALDVSFGSQLPGFLPMEAACVSLCSLWQKLDCYRCNAKVLQEV